MMRRLLIPGTSLRASPIALGVMNWGTRTDEAAALRLHNAYLAAGGNTLDTAHIYAAWIPNGAGASERLLGSILRRQGTRRQVIVISKGGHPAEPFYPHPDRYLAPEALASDVNDSLSRLGIDQLDLFFLHRDDPRVPVAEIIDALNQLVSAGAIRYFGASNWRVERIEEANRYAASKGVMGFVASQPQFTLAHSNKPNPDTDPALRHLAPADRAWHERTGLPAFCYSPAAYGFFASNGTKGVKTFDNPTSRARLARVNELAAKLHATPGQIALAWIMAQKFPAIPILGTGDAAHLAESLAATHLKLSTEELRWLEDGTGLM